MFFFASSEQKKLREDVKNNLEICFRSFEDKSQDKYKKAMEFISRHIQNNNQDVIEMAVDSIKSTIKDDDLPPVRKYQAIRLLRDLMKAEIKNKNKSLGKYVLKKIFKRLTVLASHNAGSTDEDKGRNIFKNVKKDQEKYSILFLNELLYSIEEWAKTWPGVSDGMKKEFNEPYKDLLTNGVNFPKEVIKPPAPQGYETSRNSHSHSPYQSMPPKSESIEKKEEKSAASQVKITSIEQKFTKKSVTISSSGLGKLDNPKSKKYFNHITPAIEQFLLVLSQIETADQDSLAFLNDMVEQLRKVISDGDSFCAEMSEEEMENDPIGRVILAALRYSEKVSNDLKKLAKKASQFDRFKGKFIKIGHELIESINSVLNPPKEQKQHKQHKDQKQVSIQKPRPILKAQSSIARTSQHKVEKVQKTEVPSSKNIPRVSTLNAYNSNSGSGNNWVIKARQEYNSNSHRDENDPHEKFGSFGIGGIGDKIKNDQNKPKQKSNFGKPDTQRPSQTNVDSENNDSSLKKPQTQKSIPSQGNEVSLQAERQRQNTFGVPQENDENSQVEQQQIFVRRKTKKGRRGAEEVQEYNEDGSRNQGFGEPNFPNDMSDSGGFFGEFDRPNPNLQMPKARNERNQRRIRSGNIGGREFAQNSQNPFENPFNSKIEESESNTFSAFNHERPSAMGSNTQLSHELQFGFNGNSILPPQINILNDRSVHQGNSKSQSQSQIKSQNHSQSNSQSHSHSHSQSQNHIQNQSQSQSRSQNKSHSNVLNDQSSGQQANRSQVSNQRSSGYQNKSQNPNSKSQIGLSQFENQQSSENPSRSQNTNEKSQIGLSQFQDFQSKKQISKDQKSFALPSQSKVSNQKSNVLPSQSQIYNQKIFGSQNQVQNERSASGFKPQQRKRRQSVNDPFQNNSFELNKSGMSNPQRNSFDDQNPNFWENQVEKQNSENKSQTNKSQIQNPFETQKSFSRKQKSVVENPFEEDNKSELSQKNKSSVLNFEMNKSFTKSQKQNPFENPFQTASNNLNRTTEQVTNPFEQTFKDDFKPKSVEKFESVSQRGSFKKVDIKQAKVLKNSQSIDNPFETMTQFKSIDEAKNQQGMMNESVKFSVKDNNENYGFDFDQFGSVSKPQRDSINTSSFVNPVKVKDDSVNNSSFVNPNLKVKTQPHEFSNSEAIGSRKNHEPQKTVTMEKTKSIHFSHFAQPEETNRSKESKQFQFSKKENSKKSIHFSDFGDFSESRPVQRQEFDGFGGFDEPSVPQKKKNDFDDFNVSQNSANDFFRQSQKVNQESNKDLFRQTQKSIEKESPFSNNDFFRQTEKSQTNQKPEDTKSRHSGFSGFNMNADNKSQKKEKSQVDWNDFDNFDKGRSTDKIKFEDSNYFGGFGQEKKHEKTQRQEESQVNTDRSQEEDQSQKKFYSREDLKLQFSENNSKYQSPEFNQKYDSTSNIQQESKGIMGSLRQVEEVKLQSQRPSINFEEFAPIQKRGYDWNPLGIKVEKEASRIFSCTDNELEAKRKELEQQKLIYNEEKMLIQKAKELYNQARKVYLEKVAKIDLILKQKESYKKILMSLGEANHNKEEEIFGLNERIKEVTSLKEKILEKEKLFFEKTKSMKEIEAGGTNYRPNQNKWEIFNRNLKMMREKEMDLQSNRYPSINNYTRTGYANSRYY